MVNTLCPQCGAPSGHPLFTQGRLCPECNFRYQSELEDQRHQAQFQAKCARDHAEMLGLQQEEEVLSRQEEEEMLRRQKEEEEERRAAKYESYLWGLPGVINKTILSINNDTDRINSLARIAEILKDIDEDDWLWLSGRNPLTFKATVAYNNLRSVLHPYIVELWQVRDSMSPSPVPMFKVIARKLLYNDIEGMRIAKETIPLKLEKPQQQLTELASLRDNTVRLIEDYKKSFTKRTKNVSYCEEKLATVTGEQNTPIDTNEISIEIKKKLTTIGLSGKIAFWFSGIMALNLLMGLPISVAGLSAAGSVKDAIFLTFFSFFFFAIVIIAPPAAYGIHRLLKAKKMRDLPEDEFNIQLGQRMQQRIEKITAKRKEAVVNASDSLATAQKLQVDAESELRNKQSELVSLEQKIVKIQERIKAVSTELLQGRVDPFFQSILDS